MIQEEKQLLIKDLCARLPYWPNVLTKDNDKGYIIGVDDTEKGLFYIHILEDGNSYDTIISIENFKIYLRPMSSLIGKELDECRTTCKYRQAGQSVLDCATPQTIDYLISHHFDYHGLIPMGLALEASKNMYKIK